MKLTGATFVTAAALVGAATVWGPSESRAEELWLRVDQLCSGTWGQQGCEKTMCDAGQNSQCTASNCNNDNCGTS